MFALGIVVITCISTGVSRTKHIPLHLACWTFVLHNQCIYTLSIINFLLCQPYSEVIKTVMKIVTQAADLVISVLLLSSNQF